METAVKKETANGERDDRIRDAASLMYRGAPQKIAAFRRHDGWGAGRDMMKVRVEIPELDGHGDVTEQIECVYERDVVGPHGLIERLAESVDRLCNGLDPQGMIQAAEDDPPHVSGEVREDGSAAEDSLHAEPLCVQLANYDLQRTHEEVAITALRNDLPAIRRDVLALAKRYNDRHAAAIGAAANRLRE